MQPITNRFISADTIIPNPADPQSFNRYSYVRNNPINLTDPSGHRECGASDDCSDPLPHTPEFVEALFRAWLYYEANFDLPFEGDQRLTGGFGQNHDGVDWGGEITVNAPASGTILKAGPDTPAGMWRIQHKTTDEIKEYSIYAGQKLRESDRDKEEDRLLEPERLLATGEWNDIESAWSHTRGTIIKIDHGHNLETFYYHTNPSIAAWTTVNQGDTLGVTANTGYSTRTHLHYTVKFNYNGTLTPINPLAPPASIRKLLTP